MRPELEFIDLTELMPYDRNPRDNAEAVGPLARSIHDFGFQVPIVLDDSNIIVAGHTRLKACLKLMEEDDCGLWGEAPAGADPDRYQNLAPKVPCIRASNLSPDEICAFRLVDNKTAELSEWDFGLLRDEREVLANAGFELEPYGFQNMPEFTPMEFLGEFGADDAYGVERVSETMALTLNIPIEYADKVKAHVSENGKEGLVDAVLREVGIGGI